ncbi:MAG TPA: deoxyhypusine synthase family protein [Vicinamibacterales bacterium]|nr:deoxyhypusine synthase family protein [Vicinamibacterales bacterium]
MPPAPMPSSPSARTGAVATFLERHFRHFNAATLVDAARAYARHVESGGAMFLTLAGAMSTAELGVSLAEMIRAGKVHAIACTGANLEEDVFNLVAHDHYVRVPHYRDLTPHDEQALLDRHLNRVTDTCIPEAEAMRRVERILIDEWRAAASRGERLFPHEFVYRTLRRPELAGSFQVPVTDSWVHAAMERDLPIFVPGWEDSTLGNVFAAQCMAGTFSDPHIVRGGIEAMIALASWYERESAARSIGFFQIGGGIAGDFPICVVPMLRQDLGRQTRLWGYFCQISDSTTSYGSYSGATPNEKITWEKLAVDTPKFIIESDATIVAPLVFAHVLNW